jgi:heme A synthase
LINTFLLIAFLAMTAWFASRDRRMRFNIPAKIWVLLAIGIAAIFFVGVSGSMAALTNMLFPSASLTEGLAKDLDPSSNYLLRLRISHPILSIISAVYLVFLAGWLKRWSAGDSAVVRWSNFLTAAILCQLALGAATLLTLAPILLQLGHLLLADLVWVSFILLGSSFIGSQDPQPTAES